MDKMISSCLAVSLFAAINVRADQDDGFPERSMGAVYTMDNASGTWVSKMGGINVGNDFPDFCGLANNDIDTMYLAGGSSAGT